LVKTTGQSDIADGSWPVVGRPLANVLRYPLVVIIMEIHDLFLTSSSPKAGARGAVAPGRCKGVSHSSAWARKSNIAL